MKWLHCPGFNCNTTWFSNLEIMFKVCVPCSRFLCNTIMNRLSNYLILHKVVSHSLASGWLLFRLPVSFKLRWSDWVLHGVRYTWVSHRALLQPLMGQLVLKNHKHRWYTVININVNPHFSDWLFLSPKWMSYPSFKCIVPAEPLMTLWTYEII